MAKSLKVGIIGASADRGWAKESHVPAVQKLDGLELAAVATNSQPSAEAAARAFGSKRAYGKAEDLIGDGEVDIVTVAVNVPDHRKLVLAALANGKHVYCEWPLGRNTPETEELSEAARSAGVHCAIGLQGRCSPAAQRARDLIGSGAIGRVLSARLYSSTIAFGPKVAKADAYLEDAQNGATLISIHGGHALDFGAAVLGELESGVALATTQFPEIEAGDEREKRARSIPDHLLLQALLSSGGALSIEVAGGRPPGAARFCLEITGEEGSVALGGNALRGFQSGRLRLSLNGQPQHVDEGEAASMPDAAANVACVYAALRDDIHRGTRVAPDFAHAARLARLIDAVMSSSLTGCRTPLT